jgi:hypothetical protein
MRHRIPGLSSSNRRRAARGGGRQIRIREDHHRGLAAQFQVDALERLGRAACHGPAAADRAGKRDHGDVGVLGEPGADHRAGARDDVDGAGRQDVRHELGELQRRQRGLLRRLDDQGVARGQDGRDLPRGHQQRVVPRGHDPHDTQRLTQDHRQVVLGVTAGGRRCGCAQRTGHEAERVDGLGDVVLCHGRRLAGVGRLQAREEAGVPGEAIRDPVQQVGPYLGRQPAPPGRRGGSGGDRGVGVLGRAVGDLGDRTPGARVDDGQGPPGRTRPEGPVDKVPNGRELVVPDEALPVLGPEDHRVLGRARDGHGHTFQNAETRCRPAASSAIRAAAAGSSAATGSRGFPTGKPAAARAALTAGMNGWAMIASMSG